VTSKQDAIAEVIDLITRHRLSLDEVRAALEGDPAAAHSGRSVSVLSRLFAYLGGIFVFVGLAIYVNMRWTDLSSAGRVLLTLGPGFFLVGFAVTCRSSSHRKSPRSESAYTAISATASAASRRSHRGNDLAIGSMLRRVMSVANIKSAGSTGGARQA